MKRKFHWQRSRCRRAANRAGVTFVGGAGSFLGLPNSIAYNTEKMLKF
jgi:hypothetical protein